MPCQGASVTLGVILPRWENLQNPASARGPHLGPDILEPQSLE